MNSSKQQVCSRSYPVVSWARLYFIVIQRQLMKFLESYFVELARNTDRPVRASRTVTARHFMTG